MEIIPSIVVSIQAHIVRPFILIPRGTIFPRYKGYRRFHSKIAGDKV